MLSKVQLDLIETIYTKKVASSVTLANLLSVSKRTIISYVKKINEIYPVLILSNKKGYYLDETLYNKIIQNQSDNSIQDSSERISFIIFQLLTGYNDSVNIANIGYELYFSETTIRSDIYKIKEMMRNYDLTISFKYNTVSIQGYELKKREFLFSSLFDESNKNIYNLNILNSAFPRYDIDKVYSFLYECIERYNYKISDYALINLLYHIVISINRISHNHIIDSQLDYDYKFIRNHDMQIAKEIANKLNTLFYINIPEIEIIQIALLIAAFISEYGHDAITIDNLRVSLWGDCYNLVYQLADDIKRIYKIDLHTTDNGFVSFALHIRSLIHRLTASIIIKNPYLYDIKHNHPIHYDCACYIASKVMEYKPYKINEDEIAYLALHINGILENQIYNSIKLKVMFILPKYSTNKDLYLYYSNEFDKYIISDYISNIELCKDLDSYDLVISTSKINHECNVPTIMISPIMSLPERKNLYTNIEKLRKKKYNILLNQSLSKICEDNFFYLNDEENLDSYHIIHKMVKAPIEKGYVSANIERDILKRESISDTAIGVIATPHSIEMNALKTTMSVMISNTPIKWGKNNVRIVLLFTIAPNEYSSSYANVLNLLSAKLQEKSYVKKLLSCKSITEFIDLVLQ